MRFSPTKSGSEGKGMDGGVSVGGGAEGTQKRKAQSVFSKKEEEEICCRHIVQMRIPNEFGKEVSPDCPCCKPRQQLPVDKKLAAQQIADKKKAREDLLEQAAWLATDIANLVEFKRERQQGEEYLLKVISRLRDEQVAWDKEQAKLPNEQRTERNVFEGYSPSNGGKGHQTPEGQHRGPAGRLPEDIDVGDLDEDQQMGWAI
ncbi:hypothetical protein KC351_g8430 [Hortaea werneckii]|nr:hypothetical protein KC351_g8430 [Hortaea werneckii]